MKLRLRFPRVILLIAGVAVAYHWLGTMSFAIGLVVFVLYELFMPPPRYRIFGPEQAQEAADNRFGIFGRNYREDEPPPTAHKPSRNEPCP